MSQSIHNNVNISCSLSRYIIIPASITDSQLIDAAKRFQGNRPPIWSWSNARGAALVKMPELSPLVTNRIQENIMFENVRKSHPQKMPPVVLELNKDISVKLIAVAFSKFASLCSPGNLQFIPRTQRLDNLLQVFTRCLFQRISGSSGCKIIIFTRW